jgi:putative ABC transport system permease protein
VTFEIFEIKIGIKFNKMRTKLVYVYRSIVKNKGISVINILGLAIGMIAVLLIFQYISFEKSYDRFFEKNNQLHRLVFYRHYKTGLDKSVGINYYLGETAFRKIPEVENFCRVKKETVYMLSGEKIFKEERVLFADSSFFDMFSHKILSGNKQKFLREPGEVIISESTALKYFGNDSPVGKIIYTHPDRKPLTITGVIGDVPDNTHLRFDMVISLSTVTNNSYCYSCNNTNTYFLIKKGSDPVKISAKITDLAEEEFASRKVEIDFPIEYQLQKLTDIHLHSNFRFEFEPNGNNKYLSILFIIALLILISAGFNYFNLFSASTGKRINSIGIRIINGASGSNIITEFITETFFTGLLSLMIAFALLFLFFPVIRSFLDLDFTMKSMLNLKTWLLPSLLLLIMSSVAGLFLGLTIYNTPPVTFIKRDIKVNRRKKSGRILLALQFLIAIVLIGCTFGAIRQIHYLQNEAFTMDLNNTIVVKRPEAKEYNTAQKSFGEALLNYPGITGIAYSTVIPGEKNGWVKGGISLKGKGNLAYQFFQSDVSPNFFDFFKVRLLAGRQFFKDETNWAGGTKHLILNKEAAMALEEENLGNLIGKSLWDNDLKEDMGEIVGIIDGYFQNSLDQVVKPTIFNCDQSGYYIYIRFNSKDAKGVVDKVTYEFNRNFGQQYFEYFFLDSYFNTQYKTHIQLFRCFILFSMMAVIISCLSLFGLVYITTISRTKEIGIRKLNGAKVREVLFLLNREYFILVTIGYIISVPIIWYLMGKWLQNFAYRIEPGIWLFVLSGLLAYLIALLTVSWISWSASTKNPVEALRYE